MHLGYCRGQPPPRRCRGERGVGAFHRPHQRPPARASRHRCGPDDRPGEALRLGGAVVRRDGHSRRRRRRSPPYADLGLPRYAAAAGDPRPGPVHLNLSWRDPLGPEPREGEVTASSALRSRGERPCRSKASTPAPRMLPPEELDTIAADLVGDRSRTHRCRPPDGPIAVPTITELADATGFPILAEPTSQLRLGRHDHAHVIWAYDAIARAKPAALAPGLVLRFGDMPTSKALRTWLRRWRMPAARG